MNTTPSIIISLLVIAGLIFSASASEGLSNHLSGSSWRLVSYGPVGEQAPAAAGIETSLDFGLDGRISGRLGCNGISGNYAVTGGEIVFSAMTTTLMACPEPQMTQEGTALQVMNGTVHFEVEGNVLTIHDASGTNVITLSR